MDTAVSSSPAEKPSGLILPAWVITLIRIILIAALPLVLILANAGIMAQEWFLRYEYYRPGFPPDSYGFSADERMHFGSLGLAYIFNDAGEEFLGDLSFPDGSPLFTTRELSHMTDVKNVTSGLSVFGFGLFGVYAACIALLALSPHTRSALFKSLRAGSLLTIALLVLGLGTTALAFDWLFTAFHGLFFEGDSWIFLYSDTLIRLYPEPLWIDAFAFVFGGAVLEALILGGVMQWLIRRPAAKL